MVQALFGSCLCKLKIGDNQGALEVVQRAIKILEKQIKKDRLSRNQLHMDEPIDNRSKSVSIESSLVDALYLKAVLNRLQKRFSEAGYVYKLFRRYCAYEEKKELIKTTFGFLMLPLSDDRRQIMDYVESML